MFGFKLSEVITNHVATVSRGTSVLEALREMMAASYDEMPVVENDMGVIGIITESDILLAAEKEMRISGLQVSEIMTAIPVMVDINASVSNVIQMMVNLNINSIPITDGGRLAGIVARRDILRRLARESAESEDTTFIFGTTTSLLSAKSSRELLRVLVDKVGSYFKASRCSVIKIHEDKGEATILASYEDARITDLSIDLKKYPEIREVCKTGKPIILRDALDFPMMKDVLDGLKGIEIKSLLVFPIVSNDKCIGTLHLRTQTENPFSKRDIKVVKMLVNIAAGAMRTIVNEENLKRLYRDAGKKVIVDHLTGLFNRRFLDIRLTEEFNMAQRHDLPLSCVMIDIDNFKVVNDTYGHDEGDNVLREFASALKKSVRVSDIAARYGGEEFLIVMPATEEMGAFMEAERIKGILDSTDFGPAGKVTASIGIASYPFPGVARPEDLIKNADTAMYEAKRTGRNCIISYGHAHSPRSQKCEPESVD